MNIDYSTTTTMEISIFSIYTMIYTEPLRSNLKICRTNRSIALESIAIVDIHRHLDSASIVALISQQELHCRVTVVHDSNSITATLCSLLLLLQCHRHHLVEMLSLYRRDAVESPSFRWSIHSSSLEPPPPYCIIPRLSL